MSALVHAASLLAAAVLATQFARAEPITFNTNFEGGSLGKVEVLGDTRFRCHVEGQQDARGRNRQATWFFFRIDNARGHELELTLTDFVGEYNGRPATPAFAEMAPVFSYDGEQWTHFATAAWDDAAKEITVRFSPERDSIFIAHIAPYTHSRLLALLAEIDRRDCALIEVFGNSALGRDLHLVTVTDTTVPDEKKRCVWLQARQHAWEAGTSWVMEGALRFITSDAPEARTLREKVVFKFTPMIDPDGCARGKVRFNANGFDVNRHWHEVRLDSKADLRRMPEIWYSKKAILAAMRAKPIDLLINMHNTETAEYLSSLIDAEPSAGRLARLFERLKAQTTFDPSRDTTTGEPTRGTTNDLWLEASVPVVLMEQRIGPSQKLGRRPTVEDRLLFGKQLVTQLAEAVVGTESER